jgi:ectoine hydroxylase-related dioxygenase (phytanoyl-CoA dioxygenase family)
MTDVATITATDTRPAQRSALAERFVSDGFVVVEDLVSSAELEAVIADAAKFARGDYRVLNPPELPADASDDEALQQILAIHFPHWVSEVARSMILHPGIIDVLQQITAAHLPHWDGAVKCCQSILFVKGPGMPGQAWHQDERYIPTRDRSLVGAWIALDDATIDNGCLWVVPGSHRNGYFWPTRAHGDSEEYDPSDQAYGFDESVAVPVEVRAGSVVFFNGYTLHRSLRNRTQGYRRALVNHYLNAWSLLPWKTIGTLPGLDIPTLDNRDVVAVGHDPYGDKGYAATPKSVFLRPVGPHQSWPDEELEGS